MVLTPVVDAAVITYWLSNELVACTKTRSPATSTPAGTVVHSVNPAVEEAASVTSKQYLVEAVTYCSDVTLAASSTAGFTECTTVPADLCWRSCLRTGDQLV